MDISSINQLVPYNQGPRQLTSYLQRESGSVPANGYPATKRYALMPPSHSPGYKIHTGDQDSTYTSSRRIKVQELNHVGSLIDIYA